MDTRTGKLYAFEDGEDIDELSKRLGIDKNQLVQIETNELTEKQLKESKVSLKDHSSKVGKILTKNRMKSLKRKGKLK